MGFGNAGRFPQTDGPASGLYQIPETGKGKTGMTISALTIWLFMATALGMAIEIRKAKRSATKLRLLLTGPSGSGKTWGALQIAKGLGGRCVVIDTEQGSSDIYDSLHNFDVVDLRPPFTPEAYIEAIRACEEAGYEVIIVDSISHEWSGKGGCLELVDDIAKAQFRGNTWSAYSVITPRHRAFIDAMLRSPAHIIATGRAKTETAQVEDGGRKKVVKLGMKTETRDGAEYEFTTVIDLVHDGHFATVSKDRTNLFTGDPKPISVETGKRLAAWLAAGHEIPAPPARSAAYTRARSAIVSTPISETTAEKFRSRIGTLAQDGELTADEAADLLNLVGQGVQ
jgi:hypothetical protein